MLPCGGISCYLKKVYCKKKTAMETLFFRIYMMSHHVKQSQICQNLVYHNATCNDVM